MAFIRKFCFCCSLELGTIVIACLGILQGIVTTVVILTNFRSRIWAGGVLEPYNIDYIRVLLGIAQIVCSTQLLISVKCQNSKFTLPWLVVNFLDLIDRCIFLLSVIFGHTHVAKINVREFAFGIALMFIIFEIWLYCWMCVLCFYLEVKNQPDKSKFMNVYHINGEAVDTEMYLI